MKVWMIRDTINDRYAKLMGPGAYVPFDWVDQDAGHVFRHDPTGLVAGFPALNERCEVLAYQLVPADLTVLTGDDVGLYVSGKLVTTVDFDEQQEMLTAFGVKCDFQDYLEDGELPETLSELAS